MNTRPPCFLLAGVALAVLIVAALLWLGSVSNAYSYFKANVHETCGQPVAMRAEGYNLLGGTRYGVDGGDPGDDVSLALVDICDPVIQVLGSGEERLWFWLSVEATGQTFSYYTWGIPEEDVHNPNANEWRDPVDPLWGYSAFTVTAIADDPSATYWPTARGELCPSMPGDLPGIMLFVDSEYGFRIPVGQTRSAWVCLRMGQGLPLPEKLQLNIQPQLARLTRWVDRDFTIVEETPATAPAGQVIQRGYALPVVHTNQDICYHAEDTHPGSILPGGGCPRSG